jgi:hypothetical protein
MVKNELIEMIRVRPSPALRKAPPIGGDVPTVLENLSGLPAKQAPWLRYLPELSYVVIHNEDGEIEKVVSMIINKAHSNVSFIFGEDDRRIPEEDTMILVDGVLGSYPNFIFWVERKKLRQFADETEKIKDQAGMAQWVGVYGIRRTDRRIWAVLDKLHQYRWRMSGDESLLDVSRYDNL